MPKKIKFNQIGEDKPIYLKPNGWLSLWCCKCKARHIWYIQILKNGIVQEGKEYSIRLDGFRDLTAEDLRRYYEKHQKKGKRGKTKN